MFQWFRCSKLKKRCFVFHKFPFALFYLGCLKVSELWMNMGWNGHGRLKQLCTSNLKYTQTITFQSLNRKRCPGLEKYSGWAQSCTSWDGFSWNKFTIITTSLGFLISPSMICRTSLWTIGACPFLSLQRRPNFSPQIGTLVAFDVGVADCKIVKLSRCFHVFFRCSCFFFCRFRYRFNLLKLLVDHTLQRFAWISWSPAMRGCTEALRTWVWGWCFHAKSELLPP